eukprot:TRINITY_DN65711_c8_g2_i1.p1 TRINITY_DN65711_c8_g2~~TRINITY_DN65711_c8_g2_i1.p1  ORF type:complete len:278 (+),score=23.77 TRINITY_DN65711_c8_g2_i1:131-964(+)
MTDATVVEHRQGLLEMKFLITDAPPESQIPAYIKLLKKHGCVHLVRVCSETYPATPVESVGIKVYHWPFDDGHTPPQSVVSNWLGLVASTFPVTPENGPPSTQPLPCIAIHCIAGLGRAPMLVALALVEYGNLAPEDAAVYVRNLRKGAFNPNQLTYIRKYKRNKKNNRKRLQALAKSSSQVNLTEPNVQQASGSNTKADGGKQTIPSSSPPPPTSNNNQQQLQLSVIPQTETAASNGNSNKEKYTQASNLSTTSTSSLAGAGSGSRRKKGCKCIIM